MNENPILTGSPAKALITFCIPIFFGNILQQIYSMVDSVVVGNYVSADALAAVGNTMPVVYMVVCVSFGLSNGASILIGQYRGAGRERDMRALISTAVIYGAGVAAVLSALCIAFTPGILKLLHTPDNIFSDSVTYLRIYFIGMVFTFAFNMISGVFRALGDSKTPLVFLAISSILNIILDLLFVIVFELGVPGVAIATVLAQGVAFVAQVLTLRKRVEEFPKNEALGVFDREALGKLTRLALPTTSQELLISLNVLITQRFVNGYGSDVIAAYTVVGKIGDLGFMPMISMYSSLSVFSAQNVGARQFDRAEKAYKVGLIYNFSVAALLAVVCLTLGRPLMRMFLGDNINDAILAVGMNYLSYQSATFTAMALTCSAEGIIKGAGDVNIFLFIAVSGAIVKVLLCFALTPAMGYSGIWLAILISWMTEALLTTWRYFTKKWKTKRLNIEE